MSTRSSQPAGSAGTDPPAGSRLDKDATVAVQVSLGPQPQTVQALAGTSAADARGILQSVNLTVAEPDEEFFADADAGTVLGVTIAPRAGGEAYDCSEGCTALEGDTATLSVSVGPVADVTGESVDSATAILADQGLSVAGTFEETSESLDAGQVIAVADREGGGSWRPGDAVTLIVSSGPPLFPVPDVLGLTRDQAKAALTTAGFEFEYNTFWDVVIDEATVVDGQDPAAGTERPKGTVVSMTISGSF